MKDVVIIGGGPGGYVAGIRAAQLDLDVTVIEKNRLGGTCLNVGCIPTKTYVATAELMKKMSEAKRFGIDLDGKFSVNFKKLVKRKNRVVNRLVKGIEHIFKKRKIELINGEAKVIDKNTVEVNNEKIKTKNIILATGSKPLIPKFLDVEGFTIDSAQALDLEKKPDHIAVVGAGVIGSEFASLWANMGVKVSLIEMEKNILPFIEKSISKRMERLLKKKNVDIYTNSKVNKVEKNKIYLEDKSVIEADKMLLSIGRKPVIEDIGLENISVELIDDTFIKVNKKLQTSVDNIYAIGDLLNTAQLAHVASKEGIIAAENIAGKEKEIDYSAVPWTIFTAPEIAYVGKTEKEVKNSKVGKFPFRANGKAMGLNETNGFVKVIADEDNCIKGMQIMGPHASDLIHEGVLAIENNLKIEDIGETIHAHPTLSESVMEAAEDALKKAVHVV